MRDHSVRAISWRATVDSCLSTGAATVTSPVDSQSRCPVCASQSCSHRRRVDRRVLTIFKPASSNLSSRVWLNSASPGCSTYREPSAAPIRRSRSRSRIPLRATSESMVAYSPARSWSVSRFTSSGIGIARMGGDASESAVVRAWDTVGLRPWMPAGATKPSVVTGSHASTAMSSDDDDGADVTWASDMWNGVLQPARRAAEKARITPARCRLSGNPIQLPSRGIVHSADPIVSVAELPRVPDRHSSSVTGSSLLLRQRASMFSVSGAQSPGVSTHSRTPPPQEPPKSRCHSPIPPRVALPLVSLGFREVKYRLESKAASGESAADAMSPDPPSPSPAHPAPDTDVFDGGVVPEAHTQVPLGTTAPKRCHGGPREGRLRNLLVPLGAGPSKSATDKYSGLV